MWLVLKFDLVFSMWLVMLVVCLLVYVWLLNKFIFLLVKVIMCMV